MKNKKAVFTAVLVFLLALVCGVLSAAAAETPAVLDSGECGYDDPAAATWCLTDDGVLRITGEGTIANVDWERSIHGPLGWASEKGVGLVKELIIEEGITRVPNSTTFQHLCAMERVYLPASLEKICEFTFEGSPCLQEFIVAPGNREMTTDACGCLYSKDMTELICYTPGSENETYVIPDGVRRIDAYSFVWTEALKKVVIPESVVEIGFEAFWSCDSLEEVYLPQHLDVLEGQIFLSCPSLVRTSLPADCTVIPDSTFGGCTSLKEIEIPQSVTELEYGAFCGCRSLETLTLPRNIVKIGRSAFGSCTNLKDVYIMMPAAKWNGRVTVDPTDNGNADLLNASLHFHEAADHVWEAAAVLEEPTAHAPGRARYVCAACGDSGEFDCAPAGEHRWNKIPLTDAGLAKGGCWLNLNGSNTLAALPNGAWSADYDTCVLKYEAAGSMPRYFGTNEFLACVCEKDVEWAPLRIGAEGAQEGELYLDAEALINAVGDGTPEEEKQQALAQLKTFFTFYYNPGGSLHVIRYDYAGLPDENGGTLSGSVTYPLDMRAEEPNAYEFDYYVLTACVKEYHITPAGPEEPEEPAQPTLIERVKAAIQTLLSFFRRLFKLTGKNGK